MLRCAFQCMEVGVTLYYRQSMNIEFLLNPTLPARLTAAAAVTVASATSLG